MRVPVTVPVPFPVLVTVSVLPTLVHACEVVGLKLWVPPKSKAPSKFQVESLSLQRAVTKGCGAFGGSLKVTERWVNPSPGEVGTPDGAGSRYWAAKSEPCAGIVVVRPPPPTFVLAVKGATLPS